MNTTGASNGFARTLLYATAGVLIWAANFLVTYVFAAVACARGLATAGPGLGPVSVVTFVASALAVVANAVIIRRAWSRRAARGDPRSCQGTEGFIDFLAAAVASLSTIAVIWTAFVGALPGGCGSPD
jgi:hypothetical protein